MNQLYKSTVAMPYPWNELETKFESDSVKEIRVIGFGSLINIESAQVSLPHAPKPARPVVVRNMMRVYDYLASAKKRRLPVKPTYQPCALNAYPMEGHELNGVLLTVTRSTFHQFKQREVGYDLIPCTTVGWQNQSKIIPHTFILSRPRVPTIPFIAARKGMVPHPVYHDLCTDGALAISQDFALEFIRTTFLSDRQTRLSEALCPIWAK